MTTRISGQIVHLEGECGAEEADTLFGYLAAKPRLVVDLAGAQRLHTSVWQILLMMKPEISGKPFDTFSAELVLPAILQEAQNAPGPTQLADGTT